MEIDVTDFVREANHPSIIASVAELGDHAGQITWKNAKQESHLHRFLSDDNRDEFCQWLQGFGAWDDDDIAGWSLPECNALLLQFIAGDVLELAALGVDLNAPVIDVDAWETLTEDGVISGRLFPGSDGRIYYYVGY